MLCTMLLASIYMLSIDKPDGWLAQSGTILGWLMLAFAVFGLIGAKFFPHYLFEEDSRQEYDRSGRFDTISKIRLRDIVEYEYGYTEALGPQADGPFTAKSPYGYFQGRHIIGRDAPLDGGVYFTGSSEVLVVDSKKYPLEFDSAYRVVTQQAGARRFLKRADEYQLLLSVYQVVCQLIPYRKNVAERFARSHSGKKLALNVYFGVGGVCRQQCLLAGYLVERLMNDGYLRGRVSVDRNSRSDGGHAWARFTNVDGVTYIIDVAQGVCDTIEAACATTRWNYRRPMEEYSEYYSDRGRPPVMAN